MKRLLYFYIWLALFALAGCGLDNYDAPSSRLTGRVVYQGRPLGLSHGKVAFNLYQEGYDKNGPISVYAAQDGSFTALLFNGTYRLETIDNNGPWLNGATGIDLEVKGDTSVDLVVTPYYLLSDVALALNGQELRAVCKVEMIAGEKEVQRLFLCVGTTAFVSDQSYSYVARKNLMPVNIGGNSLSLDISEQLALYDTLYARLGLQINGVQECIFSDVIKIK